MIPVGTLLAILRLKDEFSGPMSKAMRSVEQAGVTAQRVGGQMQSVGASLMPLSLALAGVGVAAVKMASDAEESENLVRESFGGMTDAATKWSNALSDSLGLNAFEVRKSSASFFLLAENMGQATDSAFDMSKQLTEVAYDLSSFMNLNPEETMRALQSGLVGNTEALRSLNVFVNQATLEQIAYAEGIAKTGEQLTQQQKFQATYAAILQQTQKAQGDLLRTQDSLTNQLRTVGNQVKQTAIEFGQKLIPVVKDVFLPMLRKMLDWLGDLVDWFGRLPKPIQTTVTVIGALAAAAGPVLVALGMMVSSIGALLPAITAVAGSLSGLLLPALAVVATAIAAYKLTDWIMEWTGLREKIDAVAEALFRWEEPASNITTQADALTKASEIAGRTIVDLDEAIRIITSDNAKMQEAFTGTSFMVEEVGNKANDAATHVSTFRVSMNAAFETTRDWTGALPAATVAVQSLSEAEFNAAENTRVLEQASQDLMETWDRTYGTAIETVIPAIERFNVGVNQLTPGIRDARDGMDEAAETTFTWSDATGALTGVLGDAGNILSVFGVNIDGVIGKITRLISSVTGFMGSISNLFGLGSGGGGLGSLLGGLFGGGGGVVGEAGPMLPSSGIGASIAGAIKGAASAVGSAFSSLGSAMVPFFTNPFTIGIGAAIAGFIGLKNLFGGPSMFEEVGRESGEAFGFKFSEGLQWHVVNQAEDLFGGDRMAAMAANLGEIISESLANGIDPGELDMLTEKIADTFSFLERGQIDAATAQREINEALAAMGPHLDQLGESGQAQIERLIRAAEAAGIEFDGMRELAEQFGITLQDEMSTTEQAVTQAATTIGNELADQIAEGANLAKLEIAELRGELLEIPTSIDVDINVNRHHETGGGYPRSKGGRPDESFQHETPPGGVLFTKPTMIGVGEVPERVWVQHESKVGASPPAAQESGGRVFNVTVHNHVSGVVVSTDEDLARVLENSQRELFRSGKLGRVLQEAVN